MQTTFWYCCNFHCRSPPNRCDEAFPVTQPAPETSSDNNCQCLLSCAAFLAVVATHSHAHMHEHTRAVTFIHCKTNKQTNKQTNKNKQTKKKKAGAGKQNASQVRARPTQHASAAARLLCPRRRLLCKERLEPNLALLASTLVGQPLCRVLQNLWGKGRRRRRRREGRRRWWGEGRKQATLPNRVSRACKKEKMCLRWSKDNGMVGTAHAHTHDTHHDTHAHDTHMTNAHLR